MTTKASGGTVRLLHTADWHIGRKFHQVDLLDQQALFGDWLVSVVAAEHIDGVLIAGDLFDRATPNGDAVDLLDDILVRVIALGAQVIAITGNHDSAERLHFGSAAMSGAGLHIRTERRSVADMGAPITLTGKSGASVEVLPIPYLDPYRVTDTGGAERRHEAVLQAVIEPRIAQLAQPSRAIAMAHTFIAGGEVCGSERELAVGGSASVGARTFKGLGHVALGHLHRPQSLLGGRAAYAGSPLAYSFSEEHTKSVRILECAEHITTRELAVDIGRPVCTLTGKLTELLTSSKFVRAEQAWVRAELTDTTLQVGAMDQLKARFPFILEIDPKGVRAQRSFKEQQAGARGTHTPVQVVDEYIDETFPGLVDTDETFIHSAVNKVLGAAA
jgi:exonuclease SbcD